jgi:hypothetical protein
MKQLRLAVRMSGLGWQRLALESLMKSSELESAQELAELARAVEAHLSPALRAQLLEADLALAGALRALVEVERAKHAHAQAHEKLAGGKLVVRASLYPDKIAAPRSDPSFCGVTNVAGQALSVRAWIGPEAAWVNLELAIG